MSEPMYPEGTPEHAAYREKLRVELAKFAAGEHPYEYPTEEELTKALPPRRRGRRRAQ